VYSQPVSEEDRIANESPAAKYMADPLDELEGRLRGLGLAYRGVFHPAPADSVPSLPDGSPALTVVLLGWTGGVQWPVFAASPEANDGLPDPLNRWSRRIIDRIAIEIGGTAFYPFDGPPWLDFQRWALQAEPVQRSPLGMLIHPEWGLWHSYRGAIGLRERLDLPRRETVAHPCDSCRERPCLSACPVSAFAADRPYDSAACRNYLKDGTADCLTRACAARRACPIAPQMQYAEPQATFHMRAFLGNRLG
jgi:hypothetical protein